MRVRNVPHNCPDNGSNAPEILAGSSGMSLALPRSGNATRWKKRC